MDLPSLLAFVKVVQSGSFTRAAEALQTQKAHLSRVISQLERELSVRLLERTTRSLSLTEAGREFFERARAILAAVDDTRQAMLQTQGEPRGTLRLTCGVEFGLLAVSDWIGDYLAQFPEVQVDADFTNRVVDIVHEGFDLAVRIGVLPDSTLTARRLGHLSYGLFASDQYLRRRGQPAQPGDLAGHNLVAFSGGLSQGAWLLTRDGQSERVKVQPRLRVNNSHAARDAIRNGLGIGVLPEILAGADQGAGGLQQVMADWSMPQVPVHAVFASARFLTPKVRAFIDLAAGRFAGNSLGAVP